MVRELFEMARTKKACIIFFDEIDAIGGMQASVWLPLLLMESFRDICLYFLLYGDLLSCLLWSRSLFNVVVIVFIIGTRFDDGAGGDNEVQRTMLELINQLDGFDPRGNIKVLMATNRY